MRVSIAALLTFFAIMDMGSGQIVYRPSPHGIIYGVSTGPQYLWSDPFLAYVTRGGLSPQYQYDCLPGNPNCFGRPSGAVVSEVTDLMTGPRRCRC